LCGAQVGDLDDDGVEWATVARRVRVRTASHREAATTRVASAQPGGRAKAKLRHSGGVPRRSDTASRRATAGVHGEGSRTRRVLDVPASGTFVNGVRAGESEEESGDCEVLKRHGGRVVFGLLAVSTCLPFIRAQSLQKNIGWIYFGLLVP